MPRVEPSAVGETTADRVMGHRPELLEAREDLKHALPDHDSRKESIAVAFADAVALDHTTISEAQVNVLLDEFTVPQLVELLIWISFECGGQMFGCLIADEPATPEEKSALAASIGQPGPARPPSARARPTARR